MTSIFSGIGGWSLAALASAGRGSMLLLDIIRQFPHIPKMRRQVLEQMHIVAVGSLPLVLTTSIFVGAVTAVLRARAPPHPAGSTSLKFANPQMADHLP